ncbi:tetratricopeptide repeat protein [Mucilaginibacter litoreus]|uniref:Tetratricopeptide repeat protein n=1 Tax=Mucilaginibacter litoreus TaxID=1048221 RepID=A0ABW3AY31_9SPHI
MAPNFRYLFLLFSILFTGAFAQDAPQLLQSAQRLSANKNYAAAITEYKKALNIDPNSATGNYGLALALYATARPAEGVPYLQTALKNTTGMPFTAACYSLLGSIYSANKQLPKAVEAYKSAVAADSTNQRIYYNLGIAYFMGRQYGEAERSFIDAINRDSSDAGSVRMYALSTFHQNKRAETLLGFCRFLQLGRAHCAVKKLWVICKLY